MINRYNLKHFLEKKILIIFKMADFEKFPFLMVFGHYNDHFVILLKYFSTKILKNYIVHLNFRTRTCPVHSVLVKTRKCSKLP